MAVTLLGIIVFMQPIINVFVAVSIIALHPLRESYMLFSDSTVTEVRLEQPPKALLPINVTLLGIVTEVRPLHSQNADWPMLVTLLGMVMEVRLEQDEKT